MALIKVMDDKELISICKSDLRPSEKIILIMIKGGFCKTRVELANKTGRKLRTLNRSLKTLAQKGIIFKEETQSKPVYKIKDWYHEE